MKKVGIWVIVIVLLSSIAFAVSEQYHPASEVSPGIFNEGSGGTFKFISNNATDYYKMFIGRQGYEQANVTNSFDVKIDNSTSSCKFDLTSDEMWHKCIGVNPLNASDNITIQGGSRFSEQEYEISITTESNYSNLTMTPEGVEIRTHSGILNVDKDNNWTVFSGSPPLDNETAATFYMTQDDSYNGQINIETYDKTYNELVAFVDLDKQFEGGQVQIGAVNPQFGLMKALLQLNMPAGGPQFKIKVDNAAGAQKAAIDVNGSNIKLTTNNDAGITFARRSVSTEGGAGKPSIEDVMWDDFGAGTKKAFESVATTNALGGTVTVSVKDTNENERAKKTASNTATGGQVTNSVSNTVNAVVATQTLGVDATGKGYQQNNFYDSTGTDQLLDVYFGTDANGGYFAVNTMNAAGSSKGFLGIDPPGDITINASGNLKLNTNEISVVAPQGMHSTPNGSAPFLSPKELVYLGYGIPNQPIMWICNQLNCSLYNSTHIPGLATVIAATDFTPGGSITGPPSNPCIPASSTGYTICVGT